MIEGLRPQITADKAANVTMPLLHIKRAHVIKDILASGLSTLEIAPVAPL
jgi:hypothetical protein